MEQCGATVWCGAALRCAALCAVLVAGCGGQQSQHEAADIFRYQAALVARDPPTNDNGGRGTADRQYSLPGEFDFNYDPEGATGYRLPQMRQYLLLAPEMVRTDMTYTVVLTIVDLMYGELQVRLMLTCDDEEYAMASVTFGQSGSKTIDLKVPEGVLPGHHELVAEGYALGGPGHGTLIFKNYTDLEFRPKYVSLFILTDRPVYDPDFPPCIVRYRVVGIRPDLTPADGAMTIYLQDANGNVARRWLMQQLRFGMFESSFEMTYPVVHGTWHIIIEAFGHKYEQQFQVHFWRFRRYEVNMTAPDQIYDTDGMFGVLLLGEHMTDKRVYGNATLLVRLMDDHHNFEPGNITMHLRYMEGEQAIGWTRTQLQDAFGVGALRANMSLHVFARVYDWEWDETQNATTVTKIIQDVVVVKRLGPEKSAFQPLKICTVYFAVARGDGTMYKGTTNRLIIVEVIHDADAAATQIESYSAVVPEDGIVKVKLKPRLEDKIITTKITHVSSGSSNYVKLYRYQNDNNQFVSVTTSTKFPTVGQYFVATVLSTFWVDVVHYVVTGNGKLIFHNTLTMLSQQTTFSFSVSRDMAPTGRLIVYCFKNDQVIMDTINFHAENQQLTKGHLGKTLGKDLRHDNVEVIGHYERGAFMALSATQYEWYRRGVAPFLTHHWVVDELETYDCPNQSPYKHTWASDSPSDPYHQSVYFNSYNGALDANSTLQSAGIVVLTDMTLMSNQECQPWSAPNEWCDWLWDGVQDDHCDSPEVPEHWPHVYTFHRKHFTDVHWAWRDTYFPATHVDEAEIEMHAPNSVETQVLHAIYMHPDNGLAISHNIIMHDLRRRMHFACDAPGDIRRGEMVGIRCLLSNFWDQYYDVSVTLHGGEDFRFIVVESYGIVSSYAPRMKAGDIQILVWMWPNEQRYVHFPIVPLVGSGEFDVTISAVSHVYSRAETVSFGVSYDGVYYGDFVPWLVDLWNKGSMITPYLESEVPQNWWTPQQREQLYIPGSLIANVEVQGDVVWPGFTEDYFTTDSTIGTPHDTAEGYIYEFAINLYILNYLRSMDILEREPEVKALEYMKSVLMRQYSYMQPDGSYRMFRREEHSCTWLTALALESLHAMFITEWAEDVFIEGATINKIAVWLAQTQTEDGAFPEVSPYYYTPDYLPITVDENGDEHTWHLSTTAYVTIVLAQATRITGETKNIVGGALARSSEFLADKVPHITHPLQMALTAYALQAVGHTAKDYAYAKLWSMRIEEHTMHWAEYPNPQNPTEVIDGKHFVWHRPDIPILSQSVMATSYAMLLMASRGLVAELKPAMIWMEDSRMGLFGWAGQLDTLVGIRALTEYTKLNRHQDYFSMEVQIEATCCAGWRETMTLNSSTMPFYGVVDVPEGWGAVTVYARGNGYAYVAYNTEVCVEKDFQVDDVEGYETFDFTIEDLQFSGRNSSIMTATICFSWLRTDWRPNSGMSVLQLTIPTGFVVDRDEIERLHWAGIPYLKRVRFEGGNIFVFLEQVTTEQTCVTLNARRWYPVANVTSSHLVQLMELEETLVFRATGYTTFTLHHLHICRVCGSFQCPYCPYYNRAARARTPSRLLLLWTLVWAAWSASHTRGGLR